MSQIVMMDTADLTPYENNPRDNDGAVEAVANSIREFGFKAPIIVDRDHVIIAGHTRLKAALSLGLKEVPVIVADDLTEEQVRAYRLADNKVAEYSRWDEDKLAEELDALDGVGMGMGRFGFEKVAESITGTATISFSLTEEQAGLVRRCLDEQDPAPWERMGNTNGNGNRLTGICEEYLRQ